MALFNADKALLVLSTPLSEEARSRLRQGVPFLEIWDYTVLANLLDKHPSVWKEFANLIALQSQIQSKIGQGGVPDAMNAQAEALLARLAAVPAGKTGWRQYEDVCIEILTYAFVPPLRLPKIQSRSEDGLDRRDAIFPIGTGHTFWENVKHEYSSRLVVAEFKNYDSPIGQNEVESLQQYLLPKAKRSFGLLCSREPPLESAIKARRRAWMLAENIILFLSDDDLKDIVRARSVEDDPSSILESQLDEFFIKLAP
jgi:hypothetical protein